MSRQSKHEGARSGRLFVYLHGYGDHPEDLSVLVDGASGSDASGGDLQLTPRGPYEVAGGWSWFESGSRGVDAMSLEASIVGLVEFIDAELANRGRKWTDVVLGGFSQGGAMALAAASSDESAKRCGTQGLRGLLLQSAFVPEMFDHEIDLGAVVARSVLIQHGRTDDVVAPFMAEDIAAMLPRGPVVQWFDGGHTARGEVATHARRWLAEMDSAHESEEGDLT